MNEMLFKTLLKRYEADIEDAVYKIQSFSENNIIIPEHPDITLEVINYWKPWLMLKRSWQQ